VSVALAHSEFVLPGVRCASCIAKVEGGLAPVAGVASARLNFTTRRVAVDHDPALTPDAIRAAIEKLGFEAQPVAEAVKTIEDWESKQLLKAMGVAGFAAMNVMLLAMSVWSGASGATRDLFHWLCALIAMPAVAYAGQPFFKSAWTAVRHGRTNMDVPISIGVILATALSLFETIVGGEHTYFDGAVGLLFFLLIGRYLDSMMRDRARHGVAALLRETAPGGTVLRPDGTATWVKAAEIEPGMRLLVAAGERLAADGIVERGSSSLDLSLITGESRAEPVAEGARVVAGTLNLDGPITVRVTAAGDRTTIAEIARLMEAAGQSRSRYVRLADRAARYYAPAVHTLSALSFIGWMVAGAGWHASLLIAVAVLIITCPCALGLAVPVAQVVAAGALMKRGILVKDGSALERLAEADAVRFDKTGTLTLGRPVLEPPLPLDEAEKPVALALAQVSTHPVARALAAALQTEGVVPAAIGDVRETPGFGVEADGARLGRSEWVGLPPAGHDGLETGFRMSHGPAKRLRFSDRLRPGAGATVSRLRSMGLDAAILSGDRAEAVVSVAAELGLAGQAGMTPQDKLAEVEALKAKGAKVLMVGDGLNDGPALAAGHVSMAPASASDVGQTAADAVFLGDSLQPVGVAVAAARRTVRIVKQNFALAIGYNVFAVPLAIAGYVTPLVAAVSMSTSSIIVILNALRLRSCAR
jgi:Cu2+-exporting ATPase